MIESKLSESDKGTEKEASEEPIKKKKRFLGYGLSDVDEESDTKKFDAEREMGINMKLRQALKTRLR